MAGPESISRKEMYRLLVLLNGSLKYIVVRLNELASLKILSPKYLRELNAITQQVKRLLKDSDENP